MVSHGFKLVQDFGPRRNSFELPFLDCHHICWNPPYQVIGLVRRIRWKSTTSVFPKGPLSAAATRVAAVFSDKRNRIAHIFLSKPLGTSSLCDWLWAFICMGVHDYICWSHGVLGYNDHEGLLLLVTSGFGIVVRCGHVSVTRQTPKCLVFVAVFLHSSSQKRTLKSKCTHATLPLWLVLQGRNKDTRLWAPSC